MKYVCDVCGWEYDEEKGYPEGGIAPGTKWKDIPDDFECPLCLFRFQCSGFPVKFKSFFVHSGFVQTYT